MADMYVDSGGSNTAPYETWAKAAPNPQTIIDYGSLAPGDNVYCKGTFQAGVTIDFDGITGTWALPIKFIGVDSGTVNEPPEIGDLGTDRYILDANGGNYPAATFDGSMEYLWFVNFGFINSGNSSGVAGSTATTDYTLWVNCSFSSNSLEGFESTGWFRYMLFKQCVFLNNGTLGTAISTTGMAMWACHCEGNGTYGVDISSSASGSVLIGCTFVDNGLTGIRDAGVSLVHNCVIDTNLDGGADGILSYFANGSKYLGVRVTNIADLEIDHPATAKAFMDFIYSDGVITEGVIPWRVPDPTMTEHVTESGGDTNDGYVSGELNLDTGATYRSEAIAIPSS